MTEAPPQPQITLDVWPHPLTAEGRVTRSRAPGAGTTLAELIAAEALHGEIVAAVDGAFVSKEDWTRTALAGGEIVTLRAGLSGGDDKSPLSVVLAIAGFIVPPLFALSPLVSGLFRLGLTLVGGLISPSREPEPAASPTRAEPASPVYSLTGGANRARVYQPLLLVLGEHRVFPDLAAAEYTEYRGNEQHLHQIFHFGLGELDIDALHLGDSPLSQFESVETEWARGGGALTLIAGNVDTETGAALEDTGWVERTTADNTARLGLDFTASLFRIDERTGNYLRHGVTVAIEYWPAGSPAHKHTHSVTLSNANATPVRRTLTYTLPAPGAYVVRVRRTTARSGDRLIHDEVAWSALRAYQPDTGDYGGQTRLGVRIRATGQLSGRLERLSAMVKQKIPVWENGAWSAPKPSSNPAWAFRWYALGIHIDGRLVAGAGLERMRIDEAGIKAWGAWCEAEGLTCNLVIDRAMTHAEVLRLIAQCGRASPSWQTGKLGAVWDQAGKPVSALITPANIAAGSFELEWAASGKAADEIVCRYIEPDLDWQWNTVRRPVPGVTAPSRTATLTLPGVTSRDQAALECNLQAARQRYHRRRLTFEMAAEGFAIARGDVVYLTHGLIDGGAGGRLLAGDVKHLTLNRAVTLSGPVGYAGPGDDYLLLRLADGTLHTSRVMHPDGEGGARETDVVLLETPLPEAPDTNGAHPLDTLWRFYAGDAPPAKVRITALEPRAGGERIRLSAIDEVDAYHAAATSDLSVPLPDIRRQRARVLAIDLSEELIPAGAGFLVELTAALTVAGPWRGGLIRVALDGGAPRTAAKLTGGETRGFWIAPPTGALTVTAVPGTEAAPLGEGFSVQYVIQGKRKPPAAPLNFLIDVLGDGTRRLRWTPPPDPDLAGARIRFAPDAEDPIDWADMTPMHKGLLTASPWETVEPPPGQWVFAIRAEDTGGRLSESGARIVASLGDQRLGGALIWRCPAATGWPGTTANAIRSDDAMDALEGAGDYTWDDIAAWDDWDSWGLGDGDDAATSMTFTTEPIDIGLSLPFSLEWSADVTGTVTFEARTADTGTALATAAWTAYTPGNLLTARWVQLRWRLTGDGSTLLRLDHLCFSLHAPVAERKLLDADTANWAGSAATGRTVPDTGLSLVTDVHLTLQSVGAGWSWTLDSKNNPTRVKLFDGAGAAADATVDAVIRGVA